MDHFRFIRHCLSLAEHGRGRTGANPMVGACLVRDGRVLAEGWHSAFGEDHAEVMLYKKLEQTIADTDQLYISLEPCCHQGKTPPCTNLILESGIRNVVIGMQDPDSKVAGKGIAQLREGGVRVTGPVLEPECRRFLRGYVSVKEKGRPWITLKSAKTKEGKVANADGSPRKITSAMQDEWSHRYLRAKHDAILVGVQTVIADDPLLTARLNKKSEQANPLRIVLDPNMRLPKNAQIISGDMTQGTMVITKSGIDSHWLTERGVRVLQVQTEGGVFDWEDLWKKLITPNADYHGITGILVEGGVRTWEQFRSAGMVDEEVSLIGV